MTNTTAELCEPDNPAAWALAQHIADHPMSTVQAAFRYLNAPLAVELHEQPAVLLSAEDARTRLVQALDAPYCQALGLTPEGLLAAYEASRTQTVDREALRKLIAAALRRAPFKELRADWSAPNGPLEITARVDDLADAALAAVLPATTNHDTDASVYASRAAEAELYVLLRKAGEPRHEAQALIDKHRDEVLHRAELRRMADETATTETPTDPVQHAPGKVICCADCRTKGYAVCLDEPAETVHGCPPVGSGLTPCCGRTPFELPLTDRISSEAPTTCTGPAAGARQDGATP